MKKKPSFYIVLGVLAAAVLCVLIIIGLMNRDGMIIRRKTDHFAFYCYKREVSYIPALAEPLEEVYAAAAQDLGIKSAGTISVIIHPSAEDMRQALGLSAGDELPAAALVQGNIHICCSQAANTQPQDQALAYQAVRQMVRATIGTDETFALTDALAAFEAQGREISPYLSGVSPSAAPSPSAIVSGPATPYLEDYFGQPNSQYAYLYAAFLADEEEGTGLLKTLRGGSPIKFKRATGYEEDRWDELWRGWLAQPGPYRSEP